MKPTISIVTPSFNSEQTVRETIEGVLSQTYLPAEYWIIDGASTDQTVEIAQSYEDQFREKGIRYTVISEPDRGIYHAMNKGISLASGEIIGIINSDDFYNPDTLQKVADFYEQTNFDIMYGDLRVFGGGKEFIKRSKPTKKFKTRFWNHPSTFVAKRVYDELPYAEQSIYDDLNFMLSARAKGYKICILNELLANFRLGGISNKHNFAAFKKRLRLRNTIYKANGCRGYRFENFMTEFMKFLLAK